jgi:ATP-dependent Lon protease
VILPKRNEGDLEDVPEAVRSKMSFIFAERVEEVVDAALTPAPAAEPPVTGNSEEPQPEEETQPAG